MAAMCRDEQAIFEVARKIDSREGREAYLQQICGDDAAIGQRVRALLAAYAESASFLESPATPPGATVDPLTGFFYWITSDADVGSYTITVHVSDDGFPPLSDTKTFKITVEPQLATISVQCCTARSQPIRAVSPSGRRPNPREPERTAAPDPSSKA